MRETPFKVKQKRFHKPPFLYTCILSVRYIYYNVWLKKEPRFYMLKEDYYIIIKCPPFVWVFGAWERGTWHNVLDTFHINSVRKDPILNFPAGVSNAMTQGDPDRNARGLSPYHVTDIYRFRSLVRVVVNTMIMHFILELISIKSTALNCLYLKQNLPVVI